MADEKNPDGKIEGEGEEEKAFRKAEEADKKGEIGEAVKQLGNGCSMEGFIRRLKNF